MKTSKTFKKYFIWLLLFLLIVVRFFITRPTYKNGDKVRITATVFSDPKVFGSRQSFSAAGIKVYLPKYPEVYYGDKIVIEGVVEDGKIKKAKLLSKDEFYGFGSSFRKKIIDFYEKNIPQPVSGLFSGVVLGSSGALSLDFWEKAKETGIAHVIVASGTNVTFVIIFVFGVTSLFLSRRKSILIVILSILLYLFLSGFQAPLIRASIMAGVSFLVESRGRILNSFKNLLLTAGVMLVVNPLWVTDLGFILSFVSTASIMIFSKKILNFFKFMPDIIKQDLSTTLSAQIGVAPIIFVTFGKFSLLSPIVNVLVLWTVPLIMILGALGGTVGLLFPFLGKLILYIGYPLGLWFTKIVEIFA